MEHKPTRKRDRDVGPLVRALETDSSACRHGEKDSISRIDCGSPCMCGRRISEGVREGGGRNERRARGRRRRQRHRRGISWGRRRNGLQLQQISLHTRSPKRGSNIQCGVVVFTADKGPARPGRACRHGGPKRSKTRGLRGTTSRRGCGAANAMVLGTGTRGSHIKAGDQRQRAIPCSTGGQVG